MKKLLFLAAAALLPLVAFSQPRPEAQCDIDSTLIMGCWEQSTPISIENREGETRVSRLVHCAGDSKIIMLCDNEGVRVNRDGEKTRFSWYAANGKLAMKNDEECPYFDCFRLRLASSSTCDTLYLERNYKNPDYKTADVWVRKKINMYESPKPINVLTEKKDYYESYKRRIIRQQKPSIWKGHFDNDGNLWVDSMVYGTVIKMTKSNQIECHVIDNPMGTRRNCKVFIVTYDSESRDIVNVSYVDEYSR